MKIDQLTEKVIAAGLTLALLLSHSHKVSAQTDTIRLKEKRLMTNALKPGLRQYLVYFQNVKDDRRLRMSVWLRDVKVENRGGEQFFSVTQRWYGGDSASYRSVYSRNRAADFSPVYHSETIGTKTKAFNWSPVKVTGADTVQNNLAKDFSLVSTEPYFNWNLDIETFEMLPLAAGKSYAINFYDAVSNVPQYVVYKVAGSEELATLDNEQVDCWKLFTESDYKGQHYTQTFWISKNGHEFLKEEDSFGAGYRYKIKLPGSATDVVKRFVK
ncbi:MAG TPA: hypothetical protein VIM77_04240 [Mucilaginibacter sp.]